jgi:hypothetical protein
MPCRTPSNGSAGESRCPPTSCYDGMCRMPSRKASGIRRMGLIRNYVPCLSRDIALSPRRSSSLMPNRRWCTMFGRCPVAARRHQFCRYRRLEHRASSECVLPARALERACGTGRPNPRRSSHGLPRPSQRFVLQRSRCLSYRGSSCATPPEGATSVAYALGLYFLVA